MRAQRACRSFRDDPIPDDVVERVLEAATFAPSAENLQPWVFVVVRAPDERAAIGDITRKAWEAGGRAYSEPRLDQRLFADVDRGARGAVSEAPVLIVVCADTSRSHEGALPASIFPAVQNLLLAAGALGLGSALTTLPTTAFADDLRAVLALPAHVRPMAVVPLGVPARPLGPPRRDPVRDHTHRERYGEGW